LRYEEIDQIVKQELKDFNPSTSVLDIYKVESIKIKGLILKTFPELEPEWN
jgi:hypothetical protein